MAPVAIAPPPQTATDYVDDIKTADLSNGTKQNHVRETGYKIPDDPIGTRRPIRVICIGAGYSGLMMAITVSEKMKDANVDFVIYERNEDLGGTWLENRYPYVSGQEVHTIDPC